MRGGNGIGIVCLNSFDELAFVKCYGIVMVAVCIHSVGYSDITHAIIRYGSNGISVLSIFLNKALQSIFINTDYIILIIQIATAHAVIYSNDSMTGFCGSDSISIIFLNGLYELIFVNAYGVIIITVIINHFGNIYITIAVSLCSSNGIGIIFLNGLHEFIFVNAYGIIVITVIINHFGNIYITVAVSLCGSNSVSIILLYKVTQLIAVDINLIRMVAIDAFIGDFQHIGFRFYGSNSIGSGNAFQLIIYPAAGSNAFYLCLYAALVRILNLYRQLAIFIQASFHAGISGISINNTLHLLVYPALRSNAVYAVGVNSAGIISNLGSQRAVCKSQFIINYFGISINNTNCNICTIFAY